MSKTKLEYIWLVDDIESFGNEAYRLTALVSLLTRSDDDDGSLLRAKLA